MKQFRILKPEEVRIGNTSLAGKIVTEKDLAGRDIPGLVKSGALEAIEPKAAPKPSGG